MIWLLVLYALTASAVCAVALLTPHTDQKVAAEIERCIVLGAANNKALKRRIDAGIDICRTDMILHLCGGVTGKSAQSEAHRMADIVEATGQDLCIVQEGHSQNTLQNAVFSKPLIPDGTKIVLVSDAAHLLRGYALFRWAGLNVVTLRKPARLKVDLLFMWSIWREALSCWLNLGRVILWTLGSALSLPKSWLIKYLS